ncbi:MAG: trypsin-like peptidase domain-containing protein [Candidatus Hydrogenedentes bacterium]|nr:trypsin-like peptidase domain-containing protein [Candidatus Hydrogenedentota bacterium]
MKRSIWLLGLCAVCLTGCVTFGGTQRAVIRAKNRVAPGLVHIRPVKEVFSGGKREEVLVVGSGFIISHDGYVVTNEHVAGEARIVRCVLYNKEEVEAEVVGTDRFTDVAVLKLVTDRTNLPAVKLGTSKDLEAGQTVLALGSPHGLARSVSLGIVSVTDRYLGSHGDMVSPYNNWIQTDAAINQGNSGGPLVNLKGEVVGVNARRLGGADNVGFAIPIDIAREVVEQIIEHGRVQRSWLGLTLQEMTRKTDDPTRHGVVIGDVDPLSPAQDAGLKPGDVMLSVNGIPTDARFVEDLPAVEKSIADLPIGEPATVRIARADEELDIEVITREKSDLKGDEIEFAEWGFTASELTPAVVRTAQLPSKMGVLVSGTQVGGPAANAQLDTGDIILKIDNLDVADLAAFKRMYDERVESKQRLVLLDVKRGALARFILLKQDGEIQQADVTGDTLEDGGDHEE